VDALAAEVVLAALEHRDADVAPERGGGRRHVLRQQLLLERLRRRRHDDAEARVERRDKVREALAGPGAGFRDEVAPVRERTGDRGGERGLLVARLVRGQGLGQTAAGGEDVVHPDSVRPASAERGPAAARSGTVRAGRWTRVLRKRPRPARLPHTV
jgi:hypothetical protein